MLAPSAFISSATAAAPLMILLLPEACHIHPYHLLDMATAQWTNMSGTVVPSGQAASSQRALNDGISLAIPNEWLTLLTKSGF